MATVTTNCGCCGEESCNHYWYTAFPDCYNVTFAGVDSPLGDVINGNTYCVVRGETAYWPGAGLYHYCAVLDPVTGCEETNSVDNLLYIVLAVYGDYGTSKTFWGLSVRLNDLRDDSLTYLVPYECQTNSWRSDEECDWDVPGYSPIYQRSPTACTFSPYTLSDSGTATVATASTCDGGGGDCQDAWDDSYTDCLCMEDTLGWLGFTVTGECDSGCGIPCTSCNEVMESPPHQRWAGEVTVTGSGDPCEYDVRFIATDGWTGAEADYHFTFTVERDGADHIDVYGSCALYWLFPDECYTIIYADAYKQFDGNECPDFTELVWTVDLVNSLCHKYDPVASYYWTLPTAPVIQLVWL